ncbi:MAG: FlgD immunoglobulin-like domain containing protein [Rhodothermales bacterium]
MKRFLLILIVMVARFAPVAGQIAWTPYENNPVISSDFDTESQSMYRPSVIKWQGKYHMWYGKFWQNTRWMAYTTSDDGISWSNKFGNSPPTFDNAVLGPSANEGAFDELEATHGSVILDGDTLKMWYSGSGYKASGIGLAWSLDGYTWTKVSGPAAGGSVVDLAMDGAGAAALTHPTVIKHDDVYHMWYARAKTELDAVIGYARSNDGKTWQVISGSGTQGAVLDYGAVGDFDRFALFFPSALYNGDHFEMWYQGLGLDVAGASIVPRVGCARSDDGVSWQKIAGEPNEAGECFRSYAQPFVMIDDGQYKMWYALSAQGNNGDTISYATSGEVGTAAELRELPARASTLEIYPNPTSSRVSIRFSSQQQGAHILEVRDMLGRIVSRVDLGIRSAGEQAAVWNGADLRGAKVPAGAYLLSVANTSTGERLTAGIVQIVR